MGVLMGKDELSKGNVELRKWCCHLRVPSL